MRDGERFEVDGLAEADDVDLVVVGAYAGDPLHVADEDATRPYELARRRCGNVAFASADAAWMPLASEAIAQAHRAVADLTTS
jgi:hypothetical protein